MYARARRGFWQRSRLEVSKRLFVMDCSGGKDPEQRVALINPEVLRVEGKPKRRRRLSFVSGNLHTPVERSLRAVVSCSGRKKENWFELDGMELTARCMLHEN